MSSNDQEIKTQCLARIPLDIDKLSSDLSKLEHFSFSNPYGEFHYGRCVCCYLWNESGEKDDLFLSSYSHSPLQTIYGKKLSYISEIITHNFNVGHLRFARIAKLEPNSLIIPHRDYVELDKSFHRLHVPLKTDQNIFFGDAANVYNLKLGEVWCLEARETHSVASFSDQDRVHLILDFAADVPIEFVFKQLKPKINPNSRGGYCKAFEIICERKIRH